MPSSSGGGGRRAPRPLRVAITGSSGLIGTRLRARLSRRGHRVLRLVRRPPRGSDEVEWNPTDGFDDPAPLEGLDALVHLAGEPIGQRWTRRAKRRILWSRSHATRALTETLAGLDRPPGVLVCASAVGFYGDRGADTLTERSRAGDGFLSEVCRAWEAACDPARGADVRVVNARFGLVLAREGGALPKMLPAYRLGLGGVVGGGRQWWSWVHVEDAVRALEHAMGTTTLAGPVNVTAPAPVTSREFVKTLGRVLQRPTLVPMPSLGVRVVFGAMGVEVLLGGQRVVPTALLATGFRFDYDRFEPALRAALAPAPPAPAR